MGDVGDVGGTPIFDELQRRFDRSPAQCGALPSTPERPPSKIIVTGGRGVGKTTFVSTVSDTRPIDVAAATDFGRITLHPDLVLYLLGTPDPAQAGFRGALGAVVLVDPRWVENAFPMINYLESDSDVPFIVAVNLFHCQVHHELGEVREALALGPHVPVTTCDARDRSSSTTTLQRLVAYAMSRLPADGG